MVVYRAALVWILRASAAALLALAAWTYAEAQRGYEAAAKYNQVEAAGLHEPALTFFLPAGATALLCLTLAEILSLLMRQTRT